MICFTRETEYILVSIPCVRTPPVCTRLCFLRLSVNPPELTVGKMCSVGKGDGEQAVDKQDVNIRKFIATGSNL